MKDKHSGTCLYCLYSVGVCINHLCNSYFKDYKFCKEWCQ